MFRHPSVRRSYHIFQPKTLVEGAVKSLPTHELLQTLGFVRQSQSGLVHWLPLGLRSLRKIEKIIRHRMNEDGGAIELSLSSISPKSLWERTGRWSNTELFKLQDAKKAEYCLTATCEEDITALMSNYITSYKDMPILVYQISRKYRDELRPRGGLLRGREFLMKDAYSFVSNREDAIAMFEKVNEVYNQIFKDLKIPFLSAWADSGSIGGDLSKEYHYVHESGEDTLLKCDTCGEISNIERAESFPDEEESYTGNVSVKYGLSKDHNTLICYYYPANRELNWNLAAEAVDQDLDKDYKEKDNKNVLRTFEEENEDIMFARILRVMDCRLTSRSNFPEFPLSQYLKNNFGQIDDSSIVHAQEKEVCGACNEGHLESLKTIEVGHTFYLATKYSKSLDARFTDRENKSGLPIEMGCYGIGVSRLIGAIGDITKDEKGFKWPSSVSQYLISICMPPSTEDNAQIMEKLRSQFVGTDLSDEVMYHFNNKLGIGARIKLSHATGIPLCVIVGPKNWPNVEIEVRGKQLSDEWKAQHELFKDKYQWRVLEGVSNQMTKHIIPVDHLMDVVRILLKGL